MRLSRRTGALVALVSLLLVLLAPDAMAGAGGTEFNNVWTLLTGWVEGLLGRIIAIVFVIVGLVAAPTIITNIVTATL